MKIHLATDHAGLDMKNNIKTYLVKKQHDIIDHGAFDPDPMDDYPDFIFPCAHAVAADPDSRGIIFGGSGQGEAMAATRIKVSELPSIIMDRMRSLDYHGNIIMPTFYH